MTERYTSNRGSEISPSNRKPEQGEGLSAANFPYFDLQKEGPTEEDKQLANSQTPTWETRIAGFVKDQKGHVSIPVAVSMTLGGGVAGGALFWSLDRAFGAEDEKPTSIDKDSFPNSFSNDGSVPTLEGLPPNLEQPFDNNAKKGSITERNTIVVNSLNEIKDIPQASDDKHSINILIPIEGLPQSGEIKYSRSLPGSAFNPIYAPEVRQYALEHDIRNNLYLKNIPAGSTIISPVNGEFMYNRIRSDDNELPEGTIDGVTFFFKDENGIVYQINISDGSAKPLSPVKNIEPRRIKDDYKNFLHPIEKGEPVLRFLEKGDIFIFAHAWPSEEFGREGTTPGNAKKVYPTNINLITLPDPSTGKDKIVVVNRQNVNLP